MDMFYRKLLLISFFTIGGVASFIIVLRGFFYLFKGYGSNAWFLYSLNPLYSRYGIKLEKLDKKKGFFERLSKGGFYQVILIDPNKSRLYDRFKLVVFILPYLIIGTFFLSFVFTVVSWR